MLNDNSRTPRHAPTEIVPRGAAAAANRCGITAAAREKPTPLFGLVPVLFALVAAVSVLAAVAQRADLVFATDSGTVSIDLEQCGNAQSGCQWRSGILNGANASYAEGDVVPFRLSIDGLARGTHTIHLNYDFTADGRVAYDFLAAYDATESVDPCPLVAWTAIPAPCVAAAPSVASFPTDPFAPSVSPGVSDVQSSFVPAQTLTLYGGTVDAIAAPVHSGTASSDSTADVLVTFTTTDPDVLLLWGAHLASSTDWRGAGAGAIGSDHWQMRVELLDEANASQNQGVSMQPNAIGPAAVSPTVTSTSTEVSTPTVVPSVTDTATATGLPSATDTPTPTATVGASATATETLVASATPTFTPTSTSTFTPTPTMAPPPTATSTLPATPTATASAILPGGVHFVGVNNWSLGSRAGTAFAQDCGASDQYLDAKMSLFQQNNIQVVRVAAYQSLATRTDGTRDWTGLDNMFAAVNAAHIKVIPALGNNWGDCDFLGAEPSYCGALVSDVGKGCTNTCGSTWYDGGYTTPTDGYPESYQSWATEVVSRYAGNPAIAAWEILNEPWSTCVHNFFVDMTTRVRAADPTTPISLGGSQSGGWDYRAENSLPNVDWATYHYYGHALESLPAGELTDLAIAQSLGKPFYVGENGVQASDINGECDTQLRADLFAQKITASRTAGVMGYLPWVFSYTEGPGSCSYNFGPQSPVMKIFAGY